MPYIDPDRREDIARHLPPVLWEIETEGELNFTITYLIDAFLGPVPNYAAYNAAIGVLECAKLELYRRLVAPYEDKKILENGDVFRYTVDTKERNESE